jgi:hypothetical protein
MLDPSHGNAVTYSLRCGRDHQATWCRLLQCTGLSGLCSCGSIPRGATALGYHQVTTARLAAEAGTTWENNAPLLAP